MRERGADCRLQIVWHPAHMHYLISESVTGHAHYGPSYCAEPGRFSALHSSSACWPVQTIFWWSSGTTKRGKTK